MRLIFFIVSGLVLISLIISAYQQSKHEKDQRRRCMNPYVETDEKCSKILSLEDKSELRWNRILILLDQILKEVKYNEQCH